MGDFETLYSQHLPAVFRYALKCVGRRDIAEEIAAEAFLALYRNFDRIDSAQLPGWLITVVKNRAVDYWRRMQLEQRNPAAGQWGNQGASDSPTVRAAAGERDLERWLIEHCANLKPVHRACLLLRFVRDMTREEIARALGITENQVKGALQFAFENLRKALPESAGRENK